LAKSLQQTMQAMEQMGNQPQSAQNDQRAISNRVKRASRPRDSSRSRSRARRPEPDDNKNGDPNQNGERDGNAWPARPRQAASSTRRLGSDVLQASATAPEYAAQIQRHYENIAGGKSATEKKK
jgi:hypothetical protein